MDVKQVNNNQQGESKMTNQKTNQVWIIMVHRKPTIHTTLSVPVNEGGFTKVFSTKKEALEFSKVFPGDELESGETVEILEW